MIRMFSNAEARELFQTARIARLGCVVNGEPYLNTGARVFAQPGNFQTGERVTIHAIAFQVAVYRHPGVAEP